MTKILIKLMYKKTNKYLGVCTIIDKRKQKKYKNIPTYYYTEENYEKFYDTTYQYALSCGEIPNVTDAINDEDQDTLPYTAS